MVKILAKQLNRRLCTKHFHCWHVHIIHKNNAFLSHWWSKDPLPSFIKLGHNYVLEQIQKKNTARLMLTWQQHN